MAFCMAAIAWLSAPVAMDAGDDDPVTLSAATQAALAEFLAEQKARESKLEKLSNEQTVSIDAFPEDWQVFDPALWISCS